MNVSHPSREKTEKEKSVKEKALIKQKYGEIYQLQQKK